MYEEKKIYPELFNSKGLKEQKKEPELTASTMPEYVQYSSQYNFIEGLRGEMHDRELTNGRILEILDGRIDFLHKSPLLVEFTKESTIPVEDGKLKKPTFSFENIIGEVCEELGETMEEMNSTDLHKSSGLNEAGLKLLTLSIIKNIYSSSNTKAKYFSEYTIPNKKNASRIYKDSVRNSKFADLVIETSEEMTIIEFKYVKLPYIEGLKNSLSHSFNDRSQLNKMKDELNDMTNEEVLELKIKAFKEHQKSKTVNETLNITYDVQLKAYLDLMENRTNKTLKGFVIFGIGNRILFK